MSSIEVAIVFLGIAATCIASSCALWKLVSYSRLKKKSDKMTGIMFLLMNATGPFTYAYLKFKQGPSVVSVFLMGIFGVCLVGAMFLLYVSLELVLKENQ